MSRPKVASSLAMSSKCRPVVGSSKIYKVPAQDACASAPPASRVAPRRRRAWWPTAADSPQAHVRQHLQLLRDTFGAAKELQGFVHGQLEHFVNVHLVGPVIVMILIVLEPDQVVN